MAAQKINFAQYTDKDLREMRKEIKDELNARATNAWMAGLSDDEKAELLKKLSTPAAKK